VNKQQRIRVTHVSGEEFYEKKKNLKDTHESSGNVLNVDETPRVLLGLALNALNRRRKV
jgi:hypothetical protein